MSGGTYLPNIQPSAHERFARSDETLRRRHVDENRVVVRPMVELVVSNM